MEMRVSLRAKTRLVSCGPGGMKILREEIPTERGIVSQGVGWVGEQRIL